MMCERNINWLPLTGLPTGDLARNPGMCHDQNELETLGSYASAQLMSHTSQGTCRWLIESELSSEDLPKWK